MAVNKAIGSSGATSIAQGLGGFGGLPESTWAPNTDVYLTGQSLVVNLELAGIKREDLRVSVEDNRLKISGHRPDTTRVARCKFLMMEINHGAFERVIEIPSTYDLSRVQASYDNGFLKVEIPLALPGTSRTVEILG